jgi:hypothetical protein
MVFWVVAYLNPEEGGSTALRNVCIRLSHGATSQKTKNSVFTAVKTTDLAKKIVYVTVSFKIVYFR